ncbi:unnamed protein product, partial [Closterium sp. Naga37s-1]
MSRYAPTVPSLARLFTLLSSSVASRLPSPAPSLPRSFHPSLLPSLARILTSLSLASTLLLLPILPTCFAHCTLDTSPTNQIPPLPPTYYTLSCLLRPATPPISPSSPHSHTPLSAPPSPPPARARYQCCGGFLPCSGHCGESKCPKFCLGVEVCLCFPSSVASTRFLIQDQLNIMNSKCDNGILAFLVCLEQLACIFAILACILQSDNLHDAAHALRCMADVVYCSVCACMQTQHKIELDTRDSHNAANAPPMSAPPQQTMQ